MTIRQIYFYNQRNKTFYISDEFCGDSCSMSWDEVLNEFQSITTLPSFLSKLSQVSKHYGDMIGARVRKVKKIEDIGYKDQTYGIISGSPGVFLNEQLSVV